MSKIYLDANILIDLALETRQCHKIAIDTLKRHISNGSIFVTSGLNLNTLFFIVADRAKEYEKAKRFIKMVLDSTFWEIYDITTNNLKVAIELMDKYVNADFEDLQQYIVAKNSGCDIIISNDKGFLNFDIKIQRLN